MIPTYVNVLKPNSPKQTHVPVAMKQIVYLHSEPRIIREEEEVQQMIINEDLQYAVVEKFSYGLPNIKVLRSLIPKQCELKRDVNIKLLSNRYVLIRTSNLEDYVSLLSKPQFYITHNQ